MWLDSFLESVNTRISQKSHLIKTTKYVGDLPKPLNFIIQETKSHESEMTCSR